MNTTVRDYGMIRSIDELKAVVDKLGQHPEWDLAYDIETGYDGPPVEGGALNVDAGAFIAGFSFTVDPSWSRYVPMRHDFASENLNPDLVWPIMKPLLEQIRIVGHNLKFEKRFTRTVGIELGCKSDTMIKAFVLSLWEMIGLKELIRVIYGHEMTEFYDLFPEAKEKERKTLRFNVLPLAPHVISYACEDTAWDLQLDRHLTYLFSKEGPGLNDILRVEMEILEILCDMEDTGVATDWDLMARQKSHAAEFILRLSQDIRETFAESIGRPMPTLNLASTKQLAAVLFSPKPEGLGLTVPRYTDKGNPSTDEKVMLSLAQELPVAKKLLRLRSLENLDHRFDTWLNSPRKNKNDFPKWQVRSLDDRVHANYKQHVVGTGRFSADNPAIQQLPKDYFWSYGEAETIYKDTLEEHKRDKDREKIARDAAQSAFPDQVYRGNFRDHFVATPGTYYLGFDYSQVELRALAGLSGEKALLDAFDRGDDVHRLTAALMLGIPLEEVSEDQRANGKTLNFATIYQQGVIALSQTLGVTQERAAELFDSYWAGLPSVAAYVQRCKQDAKKRRPAHSLSYFGRRWTLWGLELKRSKALYARGERQAVNGPVQGWAADYMKYAMIRLYRRLKADGLWNGRVKLIMNQHDALLFEVDASLNPAEMVAYLRPMVEFEVTGFPHIVSDWEFGYRYGSLRKLDETTRVSLDTGSQRWSLLDDKGVVEKDFEDLLPTVMQTDFHQTGLDQLPDIPDDPYDPGTVIIEVDRAPEEGEIRALRDLCYAKPGPYRVVLKTGIGELETEWFSSIGPDDAVEVSLALAGASVYHPRKSVDMAAMAEVL